MTGTPSMPPEVRRFWDAFLAQLEDPAAAEARFYEVFRIGDSPADADEGARLVLSGAKTATSSLLWEYEAGEARPPFEGALSILMDGRGAPLCVLETIWLEVQSFDQVDARFARDYGEWDGTLATWRKECWEFYAEHCATLKRTPSPDMPLVCERFQIVYPRRG